MTQTQRAKVWGVQTYPLWLNGHYVRQATTVIFEDGTEVRFMEKVPKKSAIRQAIPVHARGDAELIKTPGYIQQKHASAMIPKLEQAIALANMRQDEAAAMRWTKVLEACINSTDFPKVSA